ncbi:histone-arginine methyltransferase CARM1-like [Cololabis saira]|uniref:histone-arginine methyltransferase CARM1-like n=1 Tax=Cololabis saira TaxID=129043 RepID=UPI002AD56B63|nr:histone-arginine methyltransferase CARM1-like [Cololabis saira]
MERRREELCFSVRVFTVEEEEEEAVAEEVQVQMEVQVQQQVRVSRPVDGQDLTLVLTREGGKLDLQDASRTSVFQFPVREQMDGCQVGGQSFMATVDKRSLLLQFRTPTDLKSFQKLLRRPEPEPEPEPEARRTRGADPDRAGPTCPIMSDSSENRRSFHGGLSQNQNLLQDHLSTATYQRAFLDNEPDFRDKVVLDVCCGSGILSFFSVQAGASRVYAVESSPMARHAQVLVQSNRLSEQILVLEGDVERVSLPGPVDVIVSEPMGYLLLNQRLMESFLRARRWLKPGGRMFPSSADLHVAPFSDEQLYCEHQARASFWQQRNFYGVNLSGLHAAAVDEFFTQPIVDTFDMHVLVGRSVKHSINFLEVTEEEIYRIEIPFVFTLLQSGLVHGLAFWFDVAFLGSKSTVWLSTAPTEPLTPWSQVRCLFQTPLFAKIGQTLSGSVLLVTDSRQSYEVQISATVDQSGFRSGNKLDLKNPFFRFYFLSET